MSKAEVTYDVDMYKKPLLKSDSDGIMQTVLNAAFMKPGNLPSLPKVGADITQYLYKFDNQLDTNKIIEDIKFACGETLVGASLGDIIFQVVPYKGENIFLLKIDVYQHGKTQEIYTALTLKNDTIKFNTKVLEK